MRTAAPEDGRFDPARVPFSTHGSWMSLSIPRGEETLFLCNCHGKANHVFLLLAERLGGKEGV